MLGVCDQLKAYVEVCELKISPCPDHKAVIMSIQCRDKQRGKGYWKLNTSVLMEDLYKEIVRDIITDTILEYCSIDGINNAQIWELVQIRVKEFSVQYCCRRSKTNSDKSNRLRRR